MDGPARRSGGATQPGAVKVGVSEEKVVPHYMFHGSYTQTGIKGVLEAGAASRTKAVRDLFEEVGGRLESIYWSFGDDDVVVIGELPDNEAAAAAAMTVAAAGGNTLSTTVLLTEAEVDAARGRSPAFRAAGT